jgi:hypothetical protein
MKMWSKVYGSFALVFFIVLLLSALAKMFFWTGVAAVLTIIYTGLFFGSIRPPFLEKTDG